MEENEELDSDFNAEDIPISDGFWNYMESYWHNNREFPQSTESQLSKKADLVSGKVPASQLPSYVDDVLEFESFETLPNPGEKGKIYVIVSDYTQYRWSGSDYIQINSADDLMTTDTSQEVTGVKRFINKGNAVGDLNLQIWGKNGAKAGVYFYSEGMDTSQINFDGYFNFKNQDDEGYRNIKAAGFMKDGYNNGFVLLAGGGHFPISEFVLNPDFNNQLSIVHKIDGTGGIYNGSTGRVNKSWFDYNWAGTGERGSTISFSGIDNEYATEIFGSYENNKFGFRTHQGDIGIWNEPAFLWHDKNLNPDDLVTYDNAIKDVNLAAKKITFAENGNIIKKQNGVQIANKVYQNYYDAGVHNGILSVKFPEVNPNPTMLTADINIYGYGSRYLGKLTVSFYKYLGGIIPNGSKAVWEVTDNFPATLVRVGMKGDGYVSILLGEPETTWGDYFSLEVSKVKTQYGAWNRDWTQGWFDIFENNILDYTTLIDIPSDVAATRSWIENNLKDNYWKKNDISSTYWGLNSDRPIAHLNGNQAQKVYTGGLLASDFYDDGINIPTNGIYSKGNIKTLNYGSAIEWAIAYNWTQNEGATTNWVNQNYIPKTHSANAITLTNIANWLPYTNHGYNMSIQPDQVGNNEFQTGFGSWNNNGGGTGGYMDYIHFGGYSDSSGGNQNLIAFRKNGPGLRQFQNTKGSHTIYGNGNYVDYWHTGNFDPDDYATTTQLDTAVTNGNMAFSWDNHANAGYAQADGSNAADTWANSAYGLNNNPTLIGKMFNSNGQSKLSDATYGETAGYVNSHGLAAGNPSDEWYYKMKFLHSNSAGYYGEIAVRMTGGNGLYYKRYEGGTDFGWIKVWDTSNFEQTHINNWNNAYSWGNHASAGYAQALENASAIGFESGNPEQPYIYHDTDGHKSLATTDWVHSQDFTTPAFVEETIAQLTREFINPYSLIYATNKLITIIITDDFTQNHVDLDSELTPGQQITIINLAPFDLDVIRNGRVIDKVLSKETTEYYTSAYPKFIRKGSYKSAEILD